MLIQHLKCAAFEVPFEINDPGTHASQPDRARGEAYLSLDPATTRDALEYLAGHGLVHAAGGRYHWAGDAFPANHVSLRNIGWDNFVIIDLETDRTLAELDWRATHTMLHEQAIYQHDAEQYQVEKLDYDNHKAFVRKVKPDYFTTALTYRTVEVIDQSRDGHLGPAERPRAITGFGDVKVIEKVTGYKKIKFFTHENAGYGDVHLPEMQMHTTSFWLTVPEAIVAELSLPRATFIEGLRALGVALETVSTVALMCDPRDLNRTIGDGDGSGLGFGEGVSATAGRGVSGPPPGRDFQSGRTGAFNPTVFLFDAHPGGVGLAERIFEQAPVLLVRAAALITGCNCRGGCPACVGPAGDPAGPLEAPHARLAIESRKSVAIGLLARLSS